MINSSFIDFKNNFLEFVQNRTGRLRQNSCILSNIDAFILLFISAAIIMTAFAGSDSIGMIALIVIILTFIKIFVQKGQNIQLQSFDGALVIYLAFCIISTINSTLFAQSLYGLSKTLIYLGYYFSVLQYLRYNKSKVIYFVLLIAAVCSFESIAAILQSRTGVLEGATWQDSNSLNPEEVLSRVFGTLKPYNPNLLGGYLVCTMPSLLILSFFDLNFKKDSKLKRNIFIASKAVLFVMIFLAAAAIFFTGSRGAYIGLGGIFAGLLLFSHKIIWQDFGLNDKIKKIWSGFILSVGTVSAFVIAASPAILKRIFSIFAMRGDSSTSFRMNVYNSSFEMFKDNWLFGIGVGNKTFREIYGLYMRSGFDALSAYCVFLETAVESGIFALLSYLVFIYLIFASGIKFISGANDTKTKIVAAGCLLTVAGVMLHGCVDTIYFRPQLQIIFWTIIAVFSVCLTKNKEETKPIKNKKREKKNA